MHKSRQTITATPWEISERDVDRNDRARALARALWGKGKIRHPEAYNAIVKFNIENNIGPKRDCPEIKYLRKVRGGFKSKHPITLAKRA